MALGLPYESPSHVLQLCDRFEVVGIATAPIEAGMVHYQVVVDASHKEFIDESMDEVIAAVAPALSNVPIAAFCYRADPDPAAVCFDDPGPEPIFYRDWLACMPGAITTGKAVAALEVGNSYCRIVAAVATDADHDTTTRKWWKFFDDNSLAEPLTDKR